MLNLLQSVPDKLQLVTTAATNVDVEADGVDVVTATQVGSGFYQQAKPTTATTTDIVDTPAAGSVRNVTYLSIRNTDAANPNTVTVLRNKNTVTSELFKCILLAGEALVCKEGIWFHHDSNGGVYGVGQSFATQADMEAGTNGGVVVSPATLGFHPSSIKCWGLFSVSGTVTVSYNITSVTDTGTGVITVTIATDFSSANWAGFTCIEFTSTTLAQSATVDTRAAGSIVLRSVVEAGSSADPVTWSFLGCGDQ